MILSLVHTPLPQLDFHNIRHHDGPGEVCEHHDHLLRWHPGARLADDVAILHWHWALPTSERPDSSPRGSGAALHAHLADLSLSTWDDAPRILPDDTSRPVDRPASSPSASLLSFRCGAAAPILGPYPLSALAFRAPFARHNPLVSLLQRWTC